MNIGHKWLIIVVINTCTPASHITHTKMELLGLLKIKFLHNNDFYLEMNIGHKWLIIVVINTGTPASQITQTKMELLGLLKIKFFHNNDFYFVNE